MEKMCKVEISASYVRELENELEAKISEIDALRVQIAESELVQVVTLKQDLAYYKRLSFTYCEDYEAACKQNRKLRKKLAKLKHQRKSVLDTLDEMFKIRGE
jgi:hypothetical protein